MSRAQTLGQSFARDLHWVAVFLRAGIGSLFLIAGLSKIPGGIAGTVGYYESLFQSSLLPGVLVRTHASIIMFVEIALGMWLLSGYRLAAAWRAAALVLFSLAAGMLFAGKYDVASDNYMYLVLSLGGLLASRFDRWALGKSAELANDDGRGALGASRAELGR